MKRFSLLIGGILAASSSAFAVFNTVSNGGFEIGELKTESAYKASHQPADWCYFKGASLEGNISLSDQVARDGQRSLKFEVPAATIANRWDFYVAQQLNLPSHIINTIATEAYFFAKTDRDIAINIYFNGKNPVDGTTDNTSNFSVNLIQGDGEWKCYKVTLPRYTWGTDPKPDGTNTIDFTKPVYVRIGINAQTVATPVTLYMDELYFVPLGKDPVAFARDKSFTHIFDNRQNGFNGPSIYRSDKSIYGFIAEADGNGSNDLAAGIGDYVEGTSAIKMNRDATLKMGMGNPVCATNAKLMISFWAKGTEGTNLMCYASELAELKNQSLAARTLTPDWKKYSFLVNYGNKTTPWPTDRPAAGAGWYTNQRLNFELKNGTYIDFVCIDTIHSGNYLAPDGGEIIDYFELNQSQEGTIAPASFSTLYPYECTYSCDNSNLTFEKVGNFGVKFSSAVVGTYTLKFLFNDNLTKIEKDIEIEITGSSSISALQKEGTIAIEGDQLIVKADKASISFVSLAGVQEKYNVAGYRVFQLKKGVNIFSICKEGEQAQTIKILI